MVTLFLTKTLLKIIIMALDLTKKLDKIFHERTRLGVMSILMASHDEISFPELAKKLELTRGNLSVHLKVLEDSGYIKSRKEFVNRKPHTTYYVTEAGKKAFEAYLKLLEQIIKNANL